MDTRLISQKRGCRQKPGQSHSVADEFYGIRDMATNLLHDIAVIIDRLDAAGELVCAAQLQLAYDNLEKKLLNQQIRNIGLTKGAAI